MLRHRGHRYLSIHITQLTARDLEKASKLLKNWPDETEPGGFPKRKEGVIASLHFNVWYHLCLAYYILGDLETAAKAFKSGNKSADIPDKLIPNTYWLYMILRQQGKTAEAKRILIPTRSIETDKTQSVDPCASLDGA